MHRRFLHEKLHELLILKCVLSEYWTGLDIQQCIGRTQSTHVPRLRNEIIDSGLLRLFFVVVVVVIFFSFA